jgi:hypothetical protein
MSEATFSSQLLNPTISSLLGDWTTFRDSVWRLDPLSLDPVFVALPALKREERLEFAVENLRTAVSRASGLAGSQQALHAALRDIGFLTLVIRSEAAEPMIAVQGLTQLLQNIGTETDHVPRDTITHYSVFNPPSARRRLFSADPQEKILVARIVESFDSLVGALRALLPLCETSSPAQLVSSCNEAADYLCRLVSAAVDVTRLVNPTFFSDVLRPHWEPLQVGANWYDGAGPVQLPIYIIDNCIWAGRDADPRYRAFADHNMRYAMKDFRALYMSTRSMVPFVSRYSPESVSTHSSDAVRHQIPLALVRILSCLTKFRRVHFRIATRVYEVRRSVEAGAVCSSGYGFEVLNPILKQTDCAYAALRSAIDH